MSRRMEIGRLFFKPRFFFRERRQEHGKGNDPKMGLVERNPEGGNATHKKNPTFVKAKYFPRKMVDFSLSDFLMAKIG